MSTLEPRGAQHGPLWEAIRIGARRNGADLSRVHGLEPFLERCEAAAAAFYPRVAKETVRAAVRQVAMAGRHPDYLEDVEQLERCDQYFWLERVLSEVAHPRRRRLLFNVIQGGARFPRVDLNSRANPANDTQAQDTAT